MKPIKVVLFSCLAGMSLSASATEQLHVYAASSMTNALNQIVESFESKNDIDVTVVYGGSSSLARQISHSAPADLFISANTKWMDYLVSQQLISNNDVTNITSNQLVVITPKGRMDTLDVNDSKAWLTALNGTRLAVGQTNAVPAGMYAKESLEHIGIWDDLKSKLAPTNNVRIALALVERKEAALGIVYKTDALYSDAVTMIATLPESSHQPIVYPAATLNERASTASFMKFLESKEAHDVFNSYGFL